MLEKSSKDDAKKSSKDDTAKKSSKDDTAKKSSKDDDAKKSFNAAAAKKSSNAAAASACHPVITKPVEDIAPEDLTPKQVLANPEKTLKRFIAYWDKHKPDLTDGRKYEPEDMLFWLKNAQKIGMSKKQKAALKRKGQHRIFKGLCSKWLHKAIAFAMKNNKWPVGITHLIYYVLATLKVEWSPMSLMA